MIAQQLYYDQIKAQRDRNVRLLGTLRLLNSNINYKKIDLKVDVVPDEEVIALLRTEAKKRRESIEIFEKAGDVERTQREKYELEVIDGYLPKLMGEEDVRKEVEAIAKESGKSGGQLIGLVMAKLKGKADGQLVAKIVSTVSS